MTKFTKEHLEEIAELARKATYKPCAMHMTNLLAVCDSEVIEEMARQLLASMEQEPVACIDRANLDYLESGADADVWPASGAGSDDVLLYAAPQLPQPAVLSVPAAMEMDDDFDSAFEHGKAVGWNAYRAAMLQAEPASNSDELPLDYLQGHKDGLEWAAQLAEANHPQTGDWLYDDPIELARAIRKGPDMPTAQAGNSPVIGIDLASEPDRSVEVRYFAPPGYVMVPKEPTEAMMLHKSGCKDHPWDDPECVMRQTRRLVWAHMLEAAAQQEVKSSLEHGMQRYAGAMQKLADAGD